MRFFHTVKKGVHRVWVDHPAFLSKVWGQTGSKLYGEKSGADYGERLCRAVRQGVCARGPVGVLCFKEQPHYYWS